MPAATNDGLLAAMLAVQAAAPTLTKDRTVTVKTKTGGEYTYSYTPLDTIVEKVGPLMAENGLVWSTRPSWREDIGPTLKYKLSHAPSKECEEGEMPLMLAEQDAQGMGSAITYMRRYALCAVLNLVADADDDGALAGANGGSGRTVGKGRPASVKQLDFLKKLLKEKRVPAAGIKVLLTDAGVENTSNVVEAVEQLTGKQASAVIDKLVNGPAPNGETDIPAEPGDFTREPVDPDPMFDPSVPQ